MTDQPISEYEDIYGPMPGDLPPLAEDLEAHAARFPTAGPTPREIVSREYGDGARPGQRTDPNDPHWGRVVRDSEYGGVDVLDVIRWVEGGDSILDTGGGLAELRDVAGDIMTLDTRRDIKAAERDKLIRQLLEIGAPVVDIARAAGVSRNQVYVIGKK